MRTPGVLLVSRGSQGADLVRKLHDAGWSSVHPEDAGAASACVAIVDPEALGTEVRQACQSLREAWPALPVVVVGDALLSSAIGALRGGAVDYLDRAASPEEFKAALERARIGSSIRAWRSTRAPRTAEEQKRDGKIWGESIAMNRLRDQIDRAAASEATAVVVGETGTGKELVARHLHATGARANGPFVVVACSSIPPQLAESELFGHVKGAFSGAAATHRGLMPTAHGGTLFLDDIGALSLELQAKLLRSLQERAVRPVGSNQEVAVDFRLVVSSSIELDELVRTQRLRSDLFYRLAVLEIRVPPLREREFDVLVIAERLLEAAAARAGKQITAFTPAAEELLLSYRWPGNVRELRNAVDYAVAVARYTLVGEEDLPDTLRPAQPAMDPADQELRWKTLEQRHIETVLRAVGGNRSRAAKQLGIDRKTLQRKLERAGVHIPPQRAQARAAVPGENHTNGNANGTNDAQPNPYRFNLR